LNSNNSNNISNMPPSITFCLGGEVLLLVVAAAVRMQLSSNMIRTITSVNGRREQEEE
jgi:hypothetical protein